MFFHPWTVLFFAVAYVGVLFAVATWGDSVSGRDHKIRRPKPLIYALSIGVYCTSWTYFGSVGVASRTGFDFIPVYLGPVLVFALGASVISRITLVAKRQNVASIADFIAARYGKNEALGALVAVIAVIGVVPYISIQLKALAFSLNTMMGAAGWTETSVLANEAGGDLALYVTVGLMIFAMMFGTRHVDATEHQDGLMLAIAVESVVKIAAFLVVGLFVTFSLAGGPFALLDKINESPAIYEVFSQAPDGGRWLTVTLLSACAILLLPRQFHVAVVENAHGSDVRRAAWLIPLYLVVINIFVVPVAVTGMSLLPNADADTYVLALPVLAESRWVALIAFIGGVSAATAMVIVETIALSIMISNNLVVPLVLLRQGEHNMFQSEKEEGSSPALITIRRIAICVILVMAYVYYWSAGNSAALAQTGLISFAAVAQFAPAFFGGLVWRRATARGAVGGIITGFLLWTYTLLIPSFIDSGWFGDELLTNGLFGIAALRPRQLLGLEFDPLTHGVLWSLLGNVAAYVALSITRQPSRIEELQASAFMAEDLTAMANPGFRLWRSSVTNGQLEDTVARYLGRERARDSFAELARARDLADDPAMEADVASLNFGERLIASAIGPASSRLVMALLLERHAKGSRKAIQLLDDASTAIQNSRDLLQSAIDNVPQGIAVFSPDQRLICWNLALSDMLSLPASLVRLGTPLIEITRSVLERGGTATNPKTFADTLHVHMGKLLDSHEVFRLRLSAERRVVDVQSGNLPDGGIVVSVTDVTQSVATADELQRANETLEQRVRERTAELTKLNAELAKAKSEADSANRGKTRFIAAASHDILQPLNAARLFTSSLVESKQTGAQQQLIRNVDASLEAVEDILSTVLDISRFDAGAVKPELSSFHMQDMLIQLEREYVPVAAEKNLKLTVLKSGAVVRSDRKLLRRILQNLISNAIKYTPSGRVLVGCKRMGSNIQLRVYDTGLGIPLAQQKMIFREFERLGRDKGETPGLGLGLSIVERMCRLLRHPLSMRSEDQRGTMFAVTVPVGRGVAAPSATANSGTVQTPQGGLSGLRVLAVDNEPAIVEGLTALLNGWGVDVVPATSAAEAIAQTEASPRRFDIILADYHIHREDGIELVQAIRQRLGSNIPAVLITADRTPRVRDKASAAGIHHLRKPVKPAALRALLAQLALQRDAAE